MQDDTADHLGVEMALAQNPAAGFANGGIGLGQKVVQSLARLQALLKRSGLGLQRFIIQGLQPGLKTGNSFQNRIHFPDDFLISIAE